MNLKTKLRIKSLLVDLSEEQYDMLDKLAQTSMRSKASLVREAITLLLKTPGSGEAY